MSSEFSIIRDFFERPVTDIVLGIGDDAAVFEITAGQQGVVAVDTLVEGVHFFAGTSPYSLGWKSLAVNLSDLAAMGALPRWMLLSLSLPTEDRQWLADFSQGLFSLADRYAVQLIGGDTTRGPLTISLTVLGDIPANQAITRAGAQFGDDIWISGVLGEGALAVLHRTHKLILPEAARVSCEHHLDLPEPRVELGLALRGLASAAIDVSDGLASDLNHVLQASGVGADIFEAMVPGPAQFLGGVTKTALRQAILAGGDDYELLFTAAPSNARQIDKLGARLGIELVRIGKIREGRDLIIYDVDHQPVQLSSQGYDHFPTHSSIS